MKIGRKNNILGLFMYTLRIQHIIYAKFKFRDILFFVKGFSFLLKFIFEFFPPPSEGRPTITFNAVG